MASATRDRYTFANESEVPAGVTDCIRIVIVNWDNIDDPEPSYLKGFSEDCDFDLPPHVAKGHEQIKALRLAAFNSKTGPMTGFQHVLKDVYIKAGNVTTETIETIWTGSVSYTVLGGMVINEEFATRTEMRKADTGTYKVTRARISADNTLLQKAIEAAMSAAEPQAA